MTLSRRSFLAGTASLLASPYIAKRCVAREAGAPLPIPPLVEVKNSAETLEAISGSSAFLSGAKTKTLGFSQAYLGPVLRVSRGETAKLRVVNRLEEPVTTHWHGLHVPAIVDGGPKLEIQPGGAWDPELPVDQPASSVWYHSHVHNRTARQVYHGLAGMIIIDDPGAPDPGLPATYGVDDLPLVIQDRAFARDGSLAYSAHHHALRHGFRGDTILVNGAVSPTAAVPSGLVRLRLLNGSNARIYHLRFADDRTFHQVASDGGLLPKPVALAALRLAPAERVEIVADFSGAAPVALLSGPDRNAMMGGGMMGGGMMGRMGAASPPQAEAGREGEFEVMRFVPDKAKAAPITRLPETLAGAPEPDFGEPARRRRISLDMMGGMGRGMSGGMRGGGMGRGGMGGGPMGGLAINGRAFDIDRVDLKLKRGETELWEVSAAMMAHPFHVHATAFQVLSDNGKPVDYATTGLKDVVLVEGRAEILLRVDHPASDAVPYLFHCHILEHEDGGMMAQFAVS